MPVNRPGRGKYVVNDSGGPLDHGQPAILDNYVGVTIKQKGNNWDVPVADQAVIAEGEQLFLITKGEVEVDQVGSLATGDAVYITAANALTATASGNTKFGRVADSQGERGLPTGKMRVDLDAKDSI